MIKLIIIFFIINGAVAFGNNNLDKLYINSDNLIINQKTQQAKFTGEVVLWFDDMVIKTTNLEIFYKIVNNNKTIDYIIIPSKLTARRTHEQKIIIANSAKYIVEQQELTLIEDVIVQTDQNIIKAKKLVYYTALNHVGF